jgi:hypothetical protein
MKWMAFLSGWLGLFAVIPFCFYLYYYDFTLSGLEWIGFGSDWV